MKTSVFHLLSVQCQFRNSSYLEMDFQPDILSPGAAMEVPVTFYPREPCRYHEKLTFILNSCVTKHVDILGQGIEMKVREMSMHTGVNINIQVFGSETDTETTLLEVDDLIYDLIKIYICVILS